MGTVKTYTLTEALSKLNEGAYAKPPEDLVKGLEIFSGYDFNGNSALKSIENALVLAVSNLNKYAVAADEENDLYVRLYIDSHAYSEDEEINKKVEEKYIGDVKNAIRYINREVLKLGDLLLDYDFSNPLRSYFKILVQMARGEISVIFNIKFVESFESVTECDEFIISVKERPYEGLHESLKRKSSKRMDESAYSDKIRIYIPEVKKIGSERFQYEVPYEEYEMSTGNKVGDGTEDFSLQRAMTDIRVYTFNAEGDEGVEYNIGPVCVNASVDEGRIEDAMKNIYDMDYVKMKSSDNLVHPMEINEMDWDF